MKSILTITNELYNKMSYVTSYEKTKLLVIVDKILNKPWTNHRMELNYYSLRYKAEDKKIYLYSKQYKFAEMYDFDDNVDMDFPTDFSVYINLDSKFEQEVSMISRLINRISNIIFVHVKKISKYFYKNRI